jgi:hypothetical protein
VQGESGQNVIEQYLPQFVDMVGIGQVIGDAGIGRKGGIAGWERGKGSGAPKDCIQARRFDQADKNAQVNNIFRVIEHVGFAKLAVELQVAISFALTKDFVVKRNRVASAKVQIFAHTR